MSRVRVYKCRGCGEKIIYIQTQSGSSMPCNAAPVYYKVARGAKGRIITPNGEVHSALIDIPPEAADGIGYISHFATCPVANRFKRPRR